MKKYANEAFNLGGGSQTSVKKKSISRVNETIGFNLFGENQVQHAKNGSQTISSGLDLGNPSSRQDAVILLNWYEKILCTIVDGRKQGDIKEDKQFPLL